MSKDETVERVAPKLIAQLNALASRLTAQGEYDAVDLIDTVVARVSAMPGRELLREALEALDLLTADVAHYDARQRMSRSVVARAAADKIRAALTEPT